MSYSDWLNDHPKATDGEAQAFLDAWREENRRFRVFVLAPDAGIRQVVMELLDRGMVEVIGPEDDDFWPLH